jgi:hypothetical protein
VARSERRRLVGATALASCAIAAVAACAPSIPLERLRCPCADTEGYLCCEREQICYRAEDMPATCAPAAGDRSTVDGYFPPPAAILATGPWLYTTATPAGDWTQPAFDTTGWWTGMPGFLGGSAAFGDSPRTPWPEGASDLWGRTTFQIDAADVPRAVLWGRWDDTLEVYVNGALAAPLESTYAPGYRYLGLNTATLMPGAVNTLAVHTTDFGGDRYLDLAVALNEALATMPMSGFERTPTLAAYATAVRQYMRAHGIPGGVLAVMKKDQLVVSRAFGWADKSFTRPMLPDAVMRTAGQEVILTAGAVATLIDAGIADPITREAITRDTRVFPLLRAHGLAPLPGRTPVPEIDEVTVGMLLGFESGVSELSGDPAQIYADLGVAPGSPITAVDNVRWVYSQPLARPLGSPSGDGWTGYMVLRHLVHVVTGDLLAFLRTAVFAPVGSSDVFIAHEPLAARDAREPGYLTLEAPFDRSIYVENFTMLATTAEAFVRYLRRYHAFWGTPLIDPRSGQWAPVPDNGTHVLFGAVAGSWTVSEQRRHDEVSLALFFNFAGDYGPLFDQLDRITDSLPESAWGL